MKKIKYLELLASLLLLSSKYFLAISSIFGWWLSIFGYMMITILNVKIQLRIAATITAGLTMLSIYGLYKWSYQTVGSQMIDFIIIGFSLLMGAILIFIEAKKRRPLWLAQTTTIIIFGFAFITLGMKMEIGWYALLLGHLNNIYLYKKKKAYIIVVIQVISIIIVLFKIFAGFGLLSILFYVL